MLSVFAGIRPLVRAGETRVTTAALSRDHTIHIENSGLMTICGGKWTTYRHMAEDCVDQAATLARLPRGPASPAISTSTAFMMTQSSLALRQCMAAMPLKLGNSCRAIPS